MDSILSLQNISKTFSEKPGEDLHVLEHINLEIGHGEFFVLLGPSGSGKSTILRIMSGLEKSYSGTMQWENGITQTDMSFVFQQFALLPWLTVYENAEMGLIMRKDLTADMRRVIVMKELRELGLERFAHAHPHELSGGMRQRTGIARAIATNPKIIFLDEPFSEVDSFTARELRKDLLAIWERRKMTIVMVTHLIEEAIELADRIAILTPRPGKIEKTITNPLPRPRNIRSPESYKLEDEMYAIIEP
ncbi:MAG: ABC transporter ATP-binding protein [Candidatus Sungbacteria bacterium]|nr:ABC transporter ATP-binding protein [Candidatus Sungbacteria bacterium]